MIGATLQILQITRETAVPPVPTQRLSGRGFDPQGTKQDETGPRPGYTKVRDASSVGHFEDVVKS